MSIKIQNFGGILMWEMRKHYSNITSRIAFPLVAYLRAPQINGFIEKFFMEKETPIFKFLMIETINRCNGRCAFCPANIKAEKREYQKMSNQLFTKIIDELVKINWTGTIFLQVNNEPLLDPRIMDFAKEIRQKKPDCRICMITNGTLLNIERVRNMIQLIDELIINDYSEKYQLSKNIADIYKYVKKNKRKFESIEIKINRRFNDEILATRAGNAPNKPKKNSHLVAPCIYPFTDFIVFPDGKVGMCCNDCLEITEFGNVNREGLLEIWNNDKFSMLRKAMKNGRNYYSFCKECDVVDAGSREKVISGEI